MHQLKASKAKIIICHEGNLSIALTAAEKVGLPKSNVFLFGDAAIDGVQPFETSLLAGEQPILLKPLTYDEAKDKVAYLCFSSGTTGKSKGVMTT